MKASEEADSLFSFKDWLTNFELMKDLYIDFWMDVIRHNTTCSAEEKRIK